MNGGSKLRLLTLVGIVGISCSAPLVKLALGQGAHPVAIALWRLLISTLLLLPAVLARADHRRALMTLSGRTAMLLLAGGTLLAFHFLFWFISLSLTTAFASTVVLCVQPIFTLLGAYLIWHEIPARASLWGILIAVAGTLLLALSAPDEGHAVGGYLYSLLSAVCLTGYLLCNKALRRRLSLTVHTFSVYGVCAVVLFFLALLLRAPLYVPGASFFLLCLMLALISTLCGHSVFNYLLKYLPAGTVAALQLGEPVGAAIIAYFLFGEKPAAMVLVGGAFILAGVVMFTIRKNRVSS